MIEARLSRYHGPARSTGRAAWPTGSMAPWIAIAPGARLTFQDL
jgi:hypothetical protein